MDASATKLRLDKWLWFARFFKTRSLSATRVAAGDVRVNGDRVTKPATAVHPGDVLTFAIGDQVRIVEVLAIGTRRGPAAEAQSLYHDLSPAPTAKMETPVPENPAYEGKGRPTKRDRRQGDLSRARHLE